MYYLSKTTNKFKFTARSTYWSYPAPASPGHAEK